MLLPPGRLGPGKRGSSSGETPMIHGYIHAQGRLEPVEDVLERLDDVVWIDLVRPEAAEEQALEQRLGFDVPTREEMEEIEASSRLYFEKGAPFMTAILPAHTEGDDPEMAPVTFVLAGDRLITVRYHEPRAFATFAARAQKSALGSTNGEVVLVALLETTVDRLADVLERAGADVDALSRRVFRAGRGRPGGSGDLRGVLEDIGRKGDLTSNIRDSLVTLERLIGFLTHALAQRGSGKDVRARIKTLARDARSLSDHSSFLSQKITFLLDATLGMINIEQNAIIKIFSVAAVVFLPPTLIASIYGMNFDTMPELEWPYGYPFALGLMLVSAVLPYLLFKRRGWL